MPETILIVDDEEPVRRTFAEWLAGSGLGCRVLVAADAEEALRLANQSAIDLAVLDWNLGAGNDGLQLLEDLAVFQPDVVAILVTGYAHQATPLDALRMGVRDYLDKNQDLNREVFIASIRRQLARILPAKRQREINQQLAAFRAAVEKVLPLVQSAALLSDPVPLPRAIASLCRFLRHLTGAADGILFVRQTIADDRELCRVYAADGALIDVPLAPFAHSVAATALIIGEPCVMNDLGSAGNIVLQAFERGRNAILAVPLATGQGVQAVLELFDRPGGFRDEDRRLTVSAAEIGADLLRRELADRQVQRSLFDAVQAALQVTMQTDSSLDGSATLANEPLPAAVLDTLREGLAADRGAAIQTDAALRLADAVRGLAERHGSPAIDHCIRLVESVRTLLDGTT